MEDLRGAWTVADVLLDAIDVWLDAPEAFENTEVHVVAVEVELKDWMEFHDARL